MPEIQTKQNTADIKKMIIENFIVYHSDETERDNLTAKLESYMEDGEEKTAYNELLNGLDIFEDELGIHTKCQNCGCSTNIG